MSAGRRKRASGIALLVTLLTAANTMLVTALSMLGALLVELSTDLHVSVAQAGQLGTATAIPWAVTALVAGPLCDRYGRRSLLTLSLLGLGFTVVVSAFAPSFRTLFALRMVTGVLGGAGPTSMMAAAGDHVPIERRGMALGWIFAGFGIAAIAGVPLAGALGGAFGWRVAFGVVGALVVLAGILIWQVLPRDPPRPHAAAGVRAVYWSVLRAPRLANLLVANVCERIVFVSVGLYLAAYLVQTYSISTVQAAPALAVAAVGTIGGNVVGGWLADRWNRPLVFASTQLTSAVLVVVLFLSPLGVVGSTLVALAFSLANAASRPSFMALAAQISEEHRGTALGMVSSSSQMGWALGAALGGLAIGVGGYVGMGILGATAAMVGAAVISPVNRTPHFRSVTSTRH